VDNSASLPPYEVRFGQNFPPYEVLNLNILKTFVYRCYTGSKPRRGNQGYVQQQTGEERRKGTSR
jgi:hypothetical protein